jgi:large subunit GTPase 1
MGKHNGKTRKKGIQVGSALLRRKMGNGPSQNKRAADDAGSRHTTDSGGDFNTQSIVEMNDLDELMNMAHLADRDFTADRYEPVVVQMGAQQIVPLTAEEKRQLEEEHKHRLTVPRRPPWTTDMTAEELDVEEKNTFLTWRRTIAVAEEDTGLSVTPFEKNLQVWRQLWRVLERSHVVAQVVDARNPLFYYCEDLRKYALEMTPAKQTVLILNKADLLPLDHRRAWAKHFNERGIKYCFFSAKLEDPNPAKRLQAQEVVDSVSQTETAAATSDADPGTDAGADRQTADAAESDPSVKVHTRDEMIEKLQDYAVESLHQAGFPDPRQGEKPSRLSVGLVGFPNVGKSSTINALKGEKKTVVSSTPGKTKHFQTLHVSDDVCICDCPGLVFPRFADSRSDMVVSGVLPIDKLTNDVRAPLDIVASHFHRNFLSNFYHIKLYDEEDLPPNRVSGKQLADAYAVIRGLILMGGRPDEMRSGRKILKDYIDGKLCYCHPPPGVTNLRQTSDLIAEEAEWLEESNNVAKGNSKSGQEQKQAMSALDMAVLEDGDGPKNQVPQASGQKKRPDYKFKKNNRKKKHGASRVHNDGGLTVGRKGGVIRISSD